MKISARLIENAKFGCLAFSAPSAVWNELLADNLSLLADKGGLSIFSFATGAELLKADMTAAETVARLNALPLRVFCREDASEGASFEENAIFKCEAFDATGSFAAGIRCQAGGDIAAATGFYQGVVSADPSLARAWNLLGLCRRLNGEVEEAEKCYHKAVELAGHMPEAFCNLGILLQKSGREDDAQQLFAHALDRDNFYFNALLRRAEWLLESGQINNPEFCELNLRLLMHFSEIGAVQRHLFRSASRFDMVIEDYSEKLHSENGAMASSKIQKLQRLIEAQVLNGAWGAAAGNMQLLMGMTPQTQAEKTVAAWCRARAERILSRLQGRLDDAAFVTVLKGLIPAEATASTPEEVRKSPLSVAEFFSLVLLEVMRDGQIEPAERELLQRLRTALNVSEDAYITMFNNVRRQLAGIEVTGGLREKFSHQRLFRNLCQAAFRDGIIEESEKKILGFACKAFDISSEEFRRIIAEVPR